MKKIIDYNYYINYEDQKFIESEIKSSDLIEEKIDIIDNFINTIIYEIYNTNDSIFEYISVTTLKKRLLKYLLFTITINKFKNTNNIINKFK